MSPEPFGIVNINKSKYVTSRAVVNAVHRLVKPAKAGHAGTLDPMATGVVLVCIGRATRLVTRIQGLPKTYRATFAFGRTSETDDATGSIQDTGASLPSAEAIEGSLREFTGEIEQVPPAFSAVHVGGRRAYKLARRGENVQLRQKTVVVSRFELMDFDGRQAEFEIECGSGTYIRSLARDLGQRLGCGGLMSALDRTQVGPFKSSEGLRPGGGADAKHEITLSELNTATDCPLKALPGVVRHECSGNDAELIRRGHTISTRHPLATTDEVALFHGNQFIAIGKPDDSLHNIRPKVVFHAIQ